MGEGDEELEKFKASMLADAGLTPSQIVAPEHFETKLPEQEIVSPETGSAKSSETLSSEATDKVKPPSEEVCFKCVNFCKFLRLSFRENMKMYLLTPSLELVPKFQRK